MADKEKTKWNLFWKISVILLGLVCLSVGIINLNGFWTSYVVDILGPAWGYILIRGQYKSSNSTFLSIKFTPDLAAVVILGICFIIETSQYFKIYDAFFDPLDYLAYCSGVLPVYFIDKWVYKQNLKV